MPGIKKPFGTPRSDHWTDAHYRPTWIGYKSDFDKGLMQDYSVNAIDRIGNWLFTIRGEGHFETASGTFHLTPGTALALISPLEGSAVNPSDSRTWEFFSIKVAGDRALAAFRQLVEQYGCIQNIGLHGRCHVRSAQMVRWIAEKPYRSAHFWSCVTYDWLQCWRMDAEQTSRRNPNCIHLEHLEISEVVPLSCRSFKEFAGRFGYSPPYLSNRIRKCWGKRPAPALREARLRKAASLLLNSRLPVEQIARTVGYSGARSLARSFRRWTHQSPLQYRHYQNRSQAGL